MIELPQIRLLADSSGGAALITFSVYMLLVFILAILAGKVRAKKSFLSEYFLGSRGLGMWALAMSFAATSASGGSFIGFPALVYTHGWVVALWIASYMIVPLVSMGLLAKRINQLSRKANAITIPDLLRARFESPKIGLLATVIIVFFMSFNLVAQFKGGSVILQSLLSDIDVFRAAETRVGSVVSGIPFLSNANVDPGYLICLSVFAVAVIAYTTFGGFRAVVWTDVLQGFVMLIGVMVLLPLTLWACGGLTNVSREVAMMTSPDSIHITITSESRVSDRFEIPRNTWFVDGDQYIRTDEAAAIESDGRIARKVSIEDISENSKPRPQSHISAILLTCPPAEQAVIEVREQFQSLSVEQASSSKPYATGSNAGDYSTIPGPDATKEAGFLTVSLAISFFFYWTFSGAGQPGNMVRLMAFRSTKTLRRALATVAIYYSLIYFPLVIIFVAARVLLPGWETQPDRVMPEMARIVTALAEVPWLAGILVAAPFAAVMSTMDSFLLMISSSVVRDIYQHWINPEASEKRLKKLTYATTLVVGLLAAAIAIVPPKFLQDLIVFTGAGLSSSLLVPMALSLYWPRFNQAGAVTGMLAGFASLVMLYAIGYVKNEKIEPYYLLGFHPFMIALFGSLSLSIIVCLATKPPPEKLVRKYFYSTS